MGGKCTREKLLEGEYGLRFPNEYASNCEVCDRRLRCCNTRSHCHLCGVTLCTNCVVIRKILRSSKPLLSCCRRCVPLPAVNLARHKPAIWKKVLAFLDPWSLDKVLQTSRFMQLSMPLPYRVIEKWDDLFEQPTFIASGAYGSVNKAYCKEVGQTVAVKMLKKRNVHSLRRWRTIMREIEIHSKIKHDHAIQLLGPKVVQTKTEVFIIMELADQDLFDKIIKQGPMEEDNARTLSRQLLGFLADMHASGVVHRDIKPENLLLRNTSTETSVKIADFGFTKVFPKIKTNEGAAAPFGPFVPVPTIVNIPHTATPSHGGLTSCTPCGTYGFAAPELIEKANRGKNSKAWLRDSLLTGLDVFAAGVVIHIMLTGCEPFSTKTTTIHLRAVKAGLRREHHIYKHLSKEAMDLMSRMLCYDSNSRPSAQECLCDAWLLKPGNGSIGQSLPRDVVKANRSVDMALSLRNRGRLHGMTPSLAVSQKGHIILYGGENDEHDAPSFEDCEEASGYEFNYAEGMSLLRGGGGARSPTNVGASPSIHDQLSAPLLVGQRSSPANTYYSVNNDEDDFDDYSSERPCPVFGVHDEIMFPEDQKPFKNIVLAE